MLETLIKRDGSREAFSNEKANNWMFWGGKDIIDRLDWSSIIMEARATAPEVLSTQDWQQTLVDKLKVRGSQPDGWPYMVMAGRLYTVLLMKRIHGDCYPTLSEQMKTVKEAGLMRDLGYTEDELDFLDKHVIKHKSNLDMVFSQVEQYQQKYALRNRGTGKVYETPQFTMMRMAMAVYEKFPKNIRLNHVKDMYDALNHDSLNPPTPTYNSLGTGHYGMASCCLIAADDTAESIKAADLVTYGMTLASAGIGLHLNTRAPGDPVDHGRVDHAGRLNYVRMFVASASANKQGMRGGALNVYDQVYSPELALMANLQNPRTPIEARERRVNVTYQTNRLFHRKVANREKFFTFTSFSAPDLYHAFFKADQTEFEELYAKYEADPNFKKNYFDAFEVLVKVLEQEIEVSTLFWNDPVEMNTHTPFLDTILQSNLCVAPETEILTDQGYFPIADLENQKVRVWNGQEFSETTVIRTSENSELMKVKFDNGLELECTPYHKFYIQTGYGNKMEEVRAHQLKPGMALIKMDLPVIEGDYTFNHPYVNGFFSGDGCETPQGQRIYLYGEKRKLRSEFPDGGKWTVQENQDREYTHYKDLEEKYFVPMSNFTIDDRLEWFAGICDSDGTIARNGDNQSLQLASTNEKFLKNILLMLQTLGVNARIGTAIPAKHQSMPNGRGGKTLYKCEELKRLLINSNDLQHLMDLGINFRRLKVEKHNPQRNASRFVRVTETEYTGRYDATFCFTEPKRHMGVFNGLLTGQCMEVMVPTKAFESITDLYGDGDPEKGEVGICNIGSIPQHNFPFDPKDSRVGYQEIKQAVRQQMEMIAYAIDNSDYRFPAIEKQAKSRRNCSVGISGVATLFAKHGLKFNTPEGRAAWHRVNERHAFACIEVALEMGQERGNAPWMHRTKWPQGWLPIDTYKKHIDTVVDNTLFFDWEDLRRRIIENKGIYFSCLIAHMPGEQATRKGTGSNSVYPLFNLSVDLSDGSSAIPWAAMDNDLIGEQYQMAWDMSPEDMAIHYGICQKFTDQGISADYYIDRIKYPKLTAVQLVDWFLARVRYGNKGKYYSRSRTFQAGAQAEIKITETFPLASMVNILSNEAAPVSVEAPKTMSALDRIAAQARAVMEDDGLGAEAFMGCGLDGACTN